MRKSAPLRYVVLQFAIAAMVALGGCDRTVYPVRISTSPNAFRLPAVKRGDVIRGVEVRNDAGVPVWEITATEDIPAKGFTVNVGAVPSGFVQLIPLPPQTFTPVKGNHYWIEIDADLRPGMHPIQVEWVGN